ncbi:MAG: PQQ-like beta-propeller repeat protein [Phycisphaerae bacterium]|nr:PQQ-like beta-propeller repeat protein [Phycisphaerae bacterium]
MKIQQPEKVLPAILSAVAAIVLVSWFAGGVDFEARVPGGDGRPAAGVEAEGPVKIEGRLTTGEGKPSEISDAWPRFRGENFDAVKNSDVPLARSWGEAGPPVLWSLELGEGFAGPAVFGGCVYLLDYDRQGEADVVRCLSLDDGKEIWRYAYPVKLKRWHGMSRTVPAVTDEYIVTIGPRCHVTCLDSKTGEFKWMYNLVSEFGTTVPQWYTAQCPLIEDGKAIIAPAGKEVLMMAVDCATGDIVWQTPNPDGWVMTHSSIVPMEFGGKRFYVYCGSGGVVGVDAENGEVLWKHTGWQMRTTVPLPVLIGGDRIFLSAGYGQFDLGCTMLKLSEADGRIAVAAEFVHNTDVFGSMQQTPVYYDGHLYGVGMDKQLACLDEAGKVLWRSSSANKFGHGPYMVADGLIYVMDDDGLLRLVQAAAGGYAELAQARVLNGPESWAPMAMVAGRLLVRDIVRMVCLDVSGQ